MKTILFYLASFWSIISINLVSAQPTLDNTFANNGIYIESTFYPANLYRYYFNSGAITNDNKIIAVGTYALQNGIINGNFVRRLTADGSIDNTFNMYVRPPGFDYLWNNDNINFSKVYIQEDNKILLGDMFFKLIARLNSNGEIDPTFGNNGEISRLIIDNIFTSFGLKVISLRKLYRANNKIFILGNASTINGNQKKIILLRFNDDGTLDTSFGINGGVIENGENGSFIVDNAKLLLISHNILASSTNLKRFDLNGQVDGTFNASTIQFTPPPGYSLNFYDTVQGGNYIYLGGIGLSNGKKTLVITAKLSLDGSVVNSYGNNGLFAGNFIETYNTYTISGDTPNYYKLLIDGDSNLFVGLTGHIVTPGISPNEDQWFKKITSTGGDGGTAVVNINNQDDYARFAIFQDNGRALLFGLSFFPGPTRPIISRIFTNNITLNVHNVTNDKEAKIYPNPTADYLNIPLKDLSVRDQFIKIYEVTGRLVLTVPISTKVNNLKIDVRSLNKGAYFIVIGDYKQKFIKE